MSSLLVTIWGGSLISAVLPGKTDATSDILSVSGHTIRVLNAAFADLAQYTQEHNLEPADSYTFRLRRSGEIFEVFARPSDPRFRDGDVTYVISSNTFAILEKRRYRLSPKQALDASPINP